MKLIDADKLLKELYITENDNDNRAQCINLFKLKELIESQKTAYDVNAVVERLEKEKQTSTSAKTEAIIGMCGASANHYGGEECAYQRAIEIVKGGSAKNWKECETNEV